MKPVIVDAFVSLSYKATANDFYVSLTTATVMPSGSTSDGPATWHR